MDKIKFAIIISFVYLGFYILTAASTLFPVWLPILLFSASPVLMLYVVFTILTNGTPSERKFDEGHWYEDREKIS
ncbi:MAG: hypothetical protein JJT77_00630 [Crocinitomicaceae bacterium]|nr:hypothetical protein [Crocinitomicaceae bacterium]